jgi:hypothetical protein
MADMESASERLRQLENTFAKLRHFLSERQAPSYSCQQAEDAISKVLENLQRIDNQRRVRTLMKRDKPGEKPATALRFPAAKKRGRKSRSDTPKKMIEDVAAELDEALEEEEDDD